MIRSLIVILCLFLYCHGQTAFWAYDPYSGQTYQTFGQQQPQQPQTSSGLAHKTKNTLPAANSFYNWFNPPSPQQPVMNPYNPWGEHAFNVPHTNAQQGCVPTSKPKIDWGNCPSLEAKEEDKKIKEDKQKDCIRDLELNENSTLEELNPTLQDRVRECVLRKDELINEAGKYNYEKAMEKLKEKGLPEDLMKKVEEAHVECKVEAGQKFLNSNKPLAEVESYQECMDFHLALLCKIKVIKKKAPVNRVNSFHGIPSNPSLSNPSPNVEENPETSAASKATSSNGNNNLHSHDFEGVMDKIEILSQALRR